MISVHVLSSGLAAFLASLVECVEALTVVLAVGSTRGWRDALMGSAAGLLVLLAIIVVAGPALAAIPLAPLQVVVGTLLLLFGLRWLRKAVLRAAGIIPLHDEARAYAQETARLRGLARAGSWDGVAFSASFQITMLEGMEVVFIVIAVGTGAAGLLVPASIGAAAALLAVVALGIAVHRPLASIPENALKLVVGAALSAFGTFWLGEGIGARWPAGDASLLVPRGGVSGAGPGAGGAVPARARAGRRGLMGRLASIARHVLGLFVDDGHLALGMLVWVAATGLLAVPAGLPPIWRGPVLFGGLALLLAWACLRAVPRRSR